MDIKQKFVEKYSNVNLHYLNRYIRLVSHDYGKLEKFEKHHILPVSLFPDFIKAKGNLIKLPLKAHFIAHHLLTKLLPDNGEMSFAFHAMCNFKRYNPKSRKEFEKLKIQGYKHISQKTRAKVLSGEHNFLGGKIQKESSSKRLKNGTHNFQGSAHNLNRVTKGIHPFVGGALNRKRAEEGTHNSQTVKPWNKSVATKDSKALWKIADEIYNYYLINPNYGRRKILKWVKCEHPEISCSDQPVDNILKFFKKGWIPKNDGEWIALKTHSPSL